MSQYTLNFKTVKSSSLKLKIDIRRFLGGMDHPWNSRDQKSFENECKQNWKAKSRLKLKNAFAYKRSFYFKVISVTLCNAHISLYKLYITLHISTYNIYIF